MKKMLALLLTGATVFSLMACAAPAAPAATAPEEAVAEEAEEAERPSFSSTVLTWTIRRIPSSAKTARSAVSM